MWVKTLRPWFHEIMSNSNPLSGNSCGKSPGSFFLLYWNIFPCTINILEQGWVKGEWSDEVGMHPQKEEKKGIGGAERRRKYVVGRWEGYIITIGCWYSFWIGLPDFAAATLA